MRSVKSCVFRNARSNSLGVIKQFPFTNDSGRQRRHHVPCTGVEIAKGQSNDIYWRMMTPNALMNAPVAKKTLGRVLRQDNAEIQSLSGPPSPRAPEPNK